MVQSEQRDKRQRTNRLCFRVALAAQHDLAYALQLLNRLECLADRIGASGILDLIPELRAALMRSYGTGRYFGLSVCPSALNPPGHPSARFRGLWSLPELSPELPLRARR